MSISQIKRHSLFLILGVVFVPCAHAQTYFDSFASRSDKVQYVSFRSQAEVEANWNTNNHDGMSYDPVEDALRFEWGATNPDTMNVSLPDIQSGTVFFTWEDRWSSEWAADGSGSEINAIRTFKNHHVKETSSSGGLMLEIRKLHKSSRINKTTTPAGAAGWVDIRSYFGNTGDLGGDSFNNILSDFLIPIEEWVRYFLFVEYGPPGNSKISLWASKPGTAPQAIYLQAPSTDPDDPGLMKRFQFQHNSSQNYSGPTSYEWCRNLVILDGVADFAEAHALVQQGSMANGDGSVVRPAAPVLNSP